MQACLDDFFFPLVVDDRELIGSIAELQSLTTGVLRQSTEIKRPIE